MFSILSSRKPLDFVLVISYILASVLGVIGIISRSNVTPWIFTVILVCCIITPFIVIAILNILPFVRTFILGLFEHRFFSRAVILTLFMMPIVGLSLLTTYLYQPPNLRFYIPFILIWPTSTMALLLRMSDSHSTREARSFTVKMLLIFGGIFLALVFLEIVLQVAFPLLPTSIIRFIPDRESRSGILVNPDVGVREYPPGQSVNYKIGGSSGDMFMMTCLREPDPTNPEPYVVQFTRDKYGFRNSMPWPDKVDLLVAGDSFTAAEAVQEPFWQGITPNTLSLGVSGIGNIEEGKLIDAYGLPRSPKVVVLAYFEGNDMKDNFDFEVLGYRGGGYESELGLSHPWEYLITFQSVRWLANEVRMRSQGCDYPIEDSYGHLLTVVFESTATMDAELLQGSRLFNLTQESILALAARVEASGGEFVIAYIPTKLHAYWPGLIEAGQLETIARNTVPWEPDEVTGVRQNWEASLEEKEQLLLRNIDDQRILLSEFAKQNRILFVDFTPAFQQAAAQSEPLYFYGDSHWNQKGHDLARKILADFLNEHGLLAG